MHEKDCDCMACREGMDKVREWQNECMEKYGWYAHFVPDPESPTGVNFHTHGLEETFKHQDIQIVCPLDPHLANSLFHSIVDLIKEGSKFKHGDLVDNIIKNYKVRFVSAIETDRFILRMIVPDREGNLLEETMLEPYHIQYADKENLFEIESN